VLGPTIRAPREAPQNGASFIRIVFGIRVFAMADPIDFSKMSRRMELAIKKRLREQDKPVAVSMIEQQKLFHTAVGQGISYWSFMEVDLIRIVAMLLDSSNEKAGVIMYSIANFPTWLDIITYLFELDGSYPHSFKAWKKLVSPLREANDTRVRLAHHAVSQNPEEYARTRKVQAYLRPSKFDARKKSRTHALKPLILEEVHDFAKRVTRLQGEIRSVYTTMRQPPSWR
jgi:hypothetical protein